MKCTEYNSPTQIDLKSFAPNSCLIISANGQGYTTVIFPKGKYKVELWGSSGGTELYSNYKGGKGGYTSGLLSVDEQKILYFYIGTKGGESNTRTAGYNGGAIAQQVVAVAQLMLELFLGHGV